MCLWFGTWIVFCFHIDDVRDIYSREITITRWRLRPHREPSYPVVVNGRRITSKCISSSQSFEKNCHKKTRIEPLISVMISSYGYVILLEATSASSGHWETKHDTSSLHSTCRRSKNRVAIRLRRYCVRIDDCGSLLWFGQRAASALVPLTRRLQILRASINAKAGIRETRITECPSRDRGIMNVRVRLEDHIRSSWIGLSIRLNHRWVIRADIIRCFLKIECHEKNHEKDIFFKCSVVRFFFIRIKRFWQLIKRYYEWLI